MSKDFTVYQATNPATPADLLAQMAAGRPDLRQFVAANPATPAATLEWLGTLGEPAVAAALARRGGYGPPSGAPVDAAPVAGPFTPPGPAAAYGPPPAHPYAPAAGHGPYGPPPGYPPPGGHAGPFTPAPAGYGYPQAQPAGSRTGLVVAIAVGAVVVLAALVFAASSVLGMLGGSAYGDDARLDRMWDRCAAGDGLACDDLYRQSPLSSEYEEFGDTCGHRFPPNTVWCEGNI